MKARSVVGALVGLALLPGAHAQAQWTNQKLVASQIAFGIGATFVGKVLFKQEPPLRALKESLLPGAAAGALAHAGYAIAGREPKLALVGKTLAQKGTLLTRRAIDGVPVFDSSFYSEWALTHSFVYVRFSGKPRAEVDVVNAAVASYFLFSDRYDLDTRRSLYSGSLVFANPTPSRYTHGYYAPGIIWIESARWNDRQVFGHEIVHSLQAERGAGIYDLHYKGLRFNVLCFASGVPAFVSGWPEHGRRWHEQEADLYAGRK